jgi:hypothetical protein
MGMIVAFAFCCALASGLFVRAHSIRQYAKLRQAGHGSPGRFRSTSVMWSGACVIASFAIIGLTGLMDSGSPSGLTYDLWLWSALLMGLALGVGPYIGLYKARQEMVQSASPGE